MDAMTRKIEQMTKEYDEMRRSLAHYESENMSSSTSSFFNPRRSKFRARRGEKTAGAPGEKANENDADGGAGSAGSGGANTKLTKNGKKLGPRYVSCLHVL